ncbi:MAG: MarR family transcriptional regulator [Acidiferrobacteraceae bacterium]|nr:MarR family transcriptional regulator [Acidiferrobacteraceae bacterium]
MERGLEKEDQLTLKLLNTVEEKSDISQRHLASELGIALGLTNSYINRCARRGLIRIRGKSPRRYLYFLTPKGFAEKAKLSTRYLAKSLGFYRASADEFRTLFQKYETVKGLRVILSGLSDLAEIAILIAGAEENIEITAIYDKDSDQSIFHQIPIYSDYSTVPMCDLIIVTCMQDPVITYTELVEKQDIENVYLPKIFGIEI